jgi:UrcA family protein
MGATTHLKSRIGYLAIALATLGVAAPAMAGYEPNPDVTVRYGDLDIDSQAGAALLLQRIEGAAVQVCARMNNGALVSRVLRDRCRQKVTAAAVARVNRPALATVYESSYRTAPAKVAMVERAR